VSQELEQVGKFMLTFPARGSRLMTILDYGVGFVKLNEHEKAIEILKLGFDLHFFNKEIDAGGLLNVSQKR
jgi:hypothetical protein